MKQKELYEKYLNFSVVFENNYRDSEYDISEEIFDEKKSWLLNITYMLGLSDIEFSNDEIEELDAKLENFKRELTKIHNI